MNTFDIWMLFALMFALLGGIGVPLAFGSQTGPLTKMERDFLEASGSYPVKLCLALAGALLVGSHFVVALGEPLTDSRGAFELLAFVMGVVGILLVAYSCYVGIDRPRTRARAAAIVNGNVG